MKKIIAYSIITVLASTAIAQQLPVNSQYMYNDFHLNSAIAGNKSYSPAIVTYRAQWVGFDGSPSTQIASLHGKIAENMGLGAVLLRDETGPYSRMGFKIAYAYHIELNDEMKLSFGLAPTLTQHVLDKNDVELADPNDLAVLGGKEKTLIPDADFGTYFYADKYFAGLAVPQLFHVKQDFTDADNTKRNHDERHYYLHGGYNFEFGEDVKLQPSALLRYVPKTPFQFDINAKVLYKNLVWLGTSYRHQDAVVIMAGFQKDKFKVGYAYDITLSDIRTQTSGSHEIFLGINIPSKIDGGSAPSMK